MVFCFASSPSLTVTVLGVTTARSMPERLMSVPRLAERSAPPNAEADLVERAGDVGRGDPVAVALPVDFTSRGRPYFTAMRGAVGDRGGGARGDDVVVADARCPSASSTSRDVVAEGADLLGLAVDREGDGLAHRGVADAGGGDGQDDGADQDGERRPCSWSVVRLCSARFSNGRALRAAGATALAAAGRARNATALGDVPVGSSGCAHRAPWLSPENFPAPGQQAHDHTEAVSSGQISCQHMYRLRCSWGQITRCGVA